MEQASGSTESLVESAFADFTAASAAVLKLLQARLGFALWTITRVADENWILLSVQDKGYGIRSGEVFRWSDSMCSRMVTGLGPEVAADVSQTPAYAEAPIAGTLDIGAYIGVPLTRPDGTVFGTMCAIDPAAQTADFQAEVPILRMFARLLSTILALELRSAAQARETEHADAAAALDPVTGAYGPSVWARALEREDERCRRYGDPAQVIAVRVNDPTDDNLRLAVRSVKEIIEDADIVGRPADDEIGALLLWTGREQAESATEDLRERLRSRGVAASVGVAFGPPGDSLEGAWDVARRAATPG